MSALRGPQVLFAPIAGIVREAARCRGRSVQTGRLRTRWCQPGWEQMGRPRPGARMRRVAAGRSVPDGSASGGVGVSQAGPDGAIPGRSAPGRSIPGRSIPGRSIPAGQGASGPGPLQHPPLACRATDDRRARSGRGLIQGAPARIEPSRIEPSRSEPAPRNLPQSQPTHRGPRSGPARYAPAAAPRRRRAADARARSAATRRPPCARANGFPTPDRIGRAGCATAYAAGLAPPAPPTAAARSRRGRIIEDARRER